VESSKMTKRVKRVKKGSGGRSRVKGKGKK